MTDQSYTGPAVSISSGDSMFVLLPLMMGFTWDDPLDAARGPEPEPEPAQPAWDPEKPDTSDVVPIAGDSHGPDDEVDSGPIYQQLDGLADEVWKHAEPTPQLLGQVLDHPFLYTAGIVVLAGAIALPIGLSGGSSAKGAPPTTASTPTTAAAPTTSAQTPTTTPAPTAPPPAPTAADAEIANFSLILPQGFEFSLESPSDAPRRETITLAFTGPGLPSTVKLSLAAGKSRELKYPTQGCGKWTVRVAAIDGKPIDSKGNPNLRNGMTHAC